MTEPTPVRLVTGASGCELELADGSRVVDGMSSWWAAIHGYRHPVLDAALAAQAGEFAHVMFGGLTHAPAIRLAERLVEITPAGLDHVFLADSGSVSVEVAIKMVLQHQRGIGRPERTRLLTVRGGYHGDTFGCMSVCDPVGGMHSMFAGVLPQHVFADRPPRATPRPPTSTPGPTRYDTSRRSTRTSWPGSSSSRCCRAPGGMHAYPAECLRVLREVADEHGLVLVFDEIATGFGRTGTLFAADAAGVTPDVMCLGKALTGGYLTLAAVLCTADVGPRALRVRERRPDARADLHGQPARLRGGAREHRPAARRRLGRTGSRHINDRLTTGLAPLRDLPGVADVRTIGAVGVVQLDHPVDVVAATDAAVAAGVWLRPFRDLIYTMPPYVISDAELDRLLGGITAGGEGRMSLGASGSPPRRRPARTPA